MRWTNVKLILGREIRDQLRDRRTLFMIAVLPMLMYPLLGTVFFQIAQFMREHPTKVLVLGSDGLAKLPGLPPLFEGDRFSPRLFDSAARGRLLQVKILDATAAPVKEDSTAAGHTEADGRRAHPANGCDLQTARALVQSGKYDVLVDFPPNFGPQLGRFRHSLAARQAPATSVRGKRLPADLPSLPAPTVYYNTASEMSQIAYRRVLGVLDQWRQQLVQSLFKEVHLPISAAKPFVLESRDVAHKGHRDAAMWSKILPFVLLIWALTGAFYPAVDLCAGEKERGTLETLLSSPAERSEIVWGKLITIMIFSMVTAILNLLSMGLTGAFIIDQLNQLPGLGAAGRLSAPPASATIWLFVALVPISALFSALCLALAAFARSTKEGQYYLMPLVLIIMPLMLLPMAPGVELTLGNSLIPVTGVVLLLRTMLEGNSMEALLYAPPVAAVTLICCLLAIRWAIDQFNKESVLFRESERLDLRLWVRHLVRDRGPTPTVGEAICCFVLILFIQFFTNLALPPLPPPGPAAFWSLAGRILISLVGVIALPALMMTFAFTSDRRQTLLLGKRPALAVIPVALLLALALHPVVHSVQYVVQTLYPVSDAVRAHAEVISRMLTDAPTSWLPFLLIAVLPALCEELAFRGFILSGLRHIGHKWWAIVLSAVFFGIAHGLLQQSIMATLLGIVLAFVAVQTGSLVPCMLFHMTHNALMLWSAHLAFTPETYSRYPQLQLFIRPLPGGQEGFVYGWPLVLAGAVATAYLLSWLNRRPYRKTAEEELQQALGHQSRVPVTEDA